MKGVPRRAPRGLPSALKHAVFSETRILPWEDPNQFKALLQAVIDEWRPVGILEEDIVVNLADCLWRKERLNVFARTQCEKEQYRKILDAKVKLITIAKRYTGDPEGLRKHVVESMPRNVALQQAVAALPRVFENTELWNLLPIRTFDHGPETLFDAFGASRAGWKKTFKLRELVDVPVVTIEDYEKFLNLVERLEGLIDGYLSRLFALKARKRMFGLDPETKNPPKPQIERFRPVKLRKAS